MTKYIRVTMPDNSKYDVPASAIAENRAKYYAENDSRKTSGPEYDAAYKEEYEYAISNDDELLDWAASNMDWDDVKDVAVLVPSDPHKVDFQEGWVNGDKKIIEK